jgi:phosphoglycerate dehydrogenase-like enzyme
MKETIHILATVPLTAEEIRKITDVSSDVIVDMAADITDIERGVEQSPGRPNDKTTRAEASRTLDSLLAKTDIMFGFRVPLNLLSRAPRLKWVQMQGAGIDSLLTGPSIFEKGIKVTNSSGLNSNAVAEFVLCLMLMIAKKAPDFLANKGAHRRERLAVNELRGKTLGIVGLGHIGRDVAKLAKALGMKVLATRQSAVNVEHDVQGVDSLFPRSRLIEMLPECDFVALTLPLTDETRGIIGERELKSMKPTAHVINVSRGKVIKQDVLIRALKEGWIGGAALDVFDPEPLPPDNELWDVNNVIISPHVAGHWDGQTGKAIDFFCENLKRFLAGEKLLNLIERNAKY